MSLLVLQKQRNVPKRRDSPEHYCWNRYPQRDVTSRGKTIIFCCIRSSASLLPFWGKVLTEHSPHKWHVTFMCVQIVLNYSSDSNCFICVNVAVSGAYRWGYLSLDLQSICPQKIDKLVRCLLCGLSYLILVLRIFFRESEGQWDRFTESQRDFSRSCPALHFFLIDWLNTNIQTSNLSLITHCFVK